MIFVIQINFVRKNTILILLIMDFLIFHEFISSFNVDVNIFFFTNKL